MDYVPGFAEAAVLRDLARLPADMREGGIAATAVLSARMLDEGILLPRDAQGFIREIRMALVQLQGDAPGDRAGDVTDEVRRKREKRLAAEG